MKTLILLCGLGAPLFYSSTFAQCPQNTELGSTVEVWDWRDEAFDMYILEDNGITNHVMILSPFYSVNNTLQENVAHLALPLDDDFEPEDGWELIYKNFGTQMYPVPEPSFSLYNRYNGLLRTFIFLTANEGNSFQAAKLDVRQFLNPIFSKNSAIFSGAHTPLSALDNFPKGTVTTSINSYTESVGTWLLSEMTLMYDPCTCNHATAVSTKPWLTSITDLNLDIVGTSLSQAMYSG